MTLPRSVQFDPSQINPVAVIAKSRLFQSTDSDTNIATSSSYRNGVVGAEQRALHIHAQGLSVSDKAGYLLEVE